MNSSLPLEISTADAKPIIDQEGGCLLLDVREQDEYDVARIDGSVLIPMSEIQSRVGELEPHKEKRIIVHCKLGGRSLQVAHWLKEQGFIQVQNLTGGIDQWSVEIDPDVPRY